MTFPERLTKLRHNESLISLRNWSLRINLRSDYILRAAVSTLNRTRIKFSTINGDISDASSLKDKRFNGRKTNIIDMLLCSSSSHSAESLRRNIPRRRFKIDISVAIRHRTDNSIKSTPEIHHIKGKLKRTKGKSASSSYSCEIRKLVGSDANANTSHHTERNIVSAVGEEAAERYRKRIRKSSRSSREQIRVKITSSRNND